MTTYRVGEPGATVFNEKGEPLARLRPGWVVVEGTRETAALPDEQAGRLIDRQSMRKRLANYADKKVTPAEDKSL